MSNIDNVRPDQKASSGGSVTWLTKDVFRILKWTGQSKNGTFFGTLTDWQLNKEQPSLKRLRTAIHCPVCGWHDDVDADLTPNQHKRTAGQIARDVIGRQQMNIIEM